MEPHRQSPSLSLRSVEAARLNTSASRQTPGKRLASAVLFGVLAVLPAAAGAAGTTDMPWVTGLCKFAGLITGPFAGALALIITAITGALIAAGEIKGFLSTALQVLLGLSIMIFASSVVNYFFNTSAQLC